VRTHEYIRPEYFGGGGFVVSGLLAARGYAETRGDWIAHRGVLAAEAEVVKRRTKEAIENGVVRVFYLRQRHSAGERCA
jgi:hypothetical protein